MSTTHKATPYARDFDTTQAHELGFYFTDYPLSYSLGLEIAESLGERLTDANDPSSSEYDSWDFWDILHETLDAVMPVYHNEILKEWQDAGCPESDEYDFGKGIWSQMTAGLYEAMSNFAWGVAGNADTLAEALERLNTLYPHKTD